MEVKMHYKNPELSPEERAEDLLTRMTLEEKLRELTMDSSGALAGEDRRFSEKKAEEVLQGIGIGALEAPKYIPQETVTYVNAVQKYLVEKTRLGIPTLIISECLHGYMTLGATVFPQAIGMASTWNKDLIQETAAAIAEEAASCGIRQGLAPDLDLAREPRWGRVEETFGEDPYLCAELGLAYIKGLQGEDENGYENKIAATVKHFCAHGSPEGGVNLSPVPCGERQLRELYLLPFAKAVKDGKAMSVMPAYSEYDGIPCSSSKFLLTDLLRNELGFQGYIFSDYGAVSMLRSFHRTAETKALAAKQALEAGMDMEAPLPECFKYLKELLENGQLDISYIDQAVKRVLCVKFKLGLFERPYLEENVVSQKVHTKKKRQLARKVAQESVILLKNEGILPLSKKINTIAVIGPNADSIELGDYSLHCDDAVSLLEGIRNHVSEETRVLYAKGCDLYEADNIRDTDAWEEAIHIAKQADVIIVAMGHTSNKDYGIGWGIDTNKKVTCGEGYDCTSLRLSGAQEDLLEELLTLSKPVVLTLINGRPVTLPCVDRLDALLEAWYAGEEAGNGIADILFGDVNPSGKLPITFPKSTGQIPLFYNHKPSARGIYHLPGSSGCPGRDYVFDDTNPMFPFGYGMSYTTFAYSDLSVEPQFIAAGDKVTVRVTVENTGDREGAEVVQLYINDLYSSTTTPVKALKGFQKITLRPKEQKQVTFEIHPSEMALVDREYRYLVEEGEFQVMIDSLKTSFRVTGSCCTDGM